MPVDRELLIKAIFKVFITIVSWIGLVVGIFFGLNKFPVITLIIVCVVFLGIGVYSLVRLEYNTLKMKKDWGI